MAYSTNSALEDELNPDELARLTGDRSGLVINYDRIDLARSRADALIDAHLWGRYQMPLAEPVSGVIEKISGDLTVCFLNEFLYKGSSLPNSVTWRKINALKLLKDIQKGNVLIPGMAPATTAPPAIISSKSGELRTFDENLLNQYWNKDDA